MGLRSRWLAIVPSATTTLLSTILLSGHALPAMQLADAYGAQTAPAATAVSEAASYPHRLIARLAARDVRADARERVIRQEHRQTIAEAATQVAPKPPRSKPQPVAVAAPRQPAISGGAFEQCVITAESGGDPTAYNDSSGASGLFGFLLSTWLSQPASSGYPGGAYTAPVSVQDEAFSELYASAGMGPWVADGCPQKFGYGG